MQKHNVAKSIKSILCLSLLGGGSSSLADTSLSDQMNSLFGPTGIFLTNQPSPPAAGGGPTIPHTAHFSSESLATLGLLVETLAPNAAEFPSISTVPGFTYTFNPEIQTFERSSSMGPVYFERPQSLGAGKFGLGLAYAYVNFEELEGQDLDGLSFLGLQHNDCCVGPPSAGVPGFERDTADLFFDEFDLTSQVLSFFGTFGITDRWDVNILVPVVFTSLDVTARAVLNDESQSDTHFFDDARTVTQQTRFIDDDKTGVGDLLLRTKYHFYEAPGLNMASALTLRVPTGDEDNFQGLGDFTVTPFFSLAHERGPFDLHIGAGVEVNTDDLDRSRVRYAAGVTYQMLQRVALLLDVIGSSGIKTQELSVAAPTFLGGSTVPTGSVVRTTELRTDLVDLAVGLKANVAESMVGFITFFVPLNDEGLRAEVIPAAGLEMSF
ncbi:MAG: transporter [Gammaproteobacteria bacterium]